MLQPQIMTDTLRWNGAFGLGFMLQRSGTRIYAGHTGGFPGSITGVFTDRAARTGAIVLMNNSVAPGPGRVRHRARRCRHRTGAAGRAGLASGHRRRAELAELLGVWFSEGTAFVFSVRQGTLEARAQAAPEHQPPAVFERVDTDLYRTLSGRERGELLRVGRDADGRVAKMNWATYLVTRQPLAFGQQG